MPKCIRPTALTLMLGIATLVLALPILPRAAAESVKGDDSDVGHIGASGVLFDGSTATARLVARTDAAPLDDFMCYSVHLPPRGFTATVSLVDRFHSRTLSLERLHRYCNPANVNGGDPAAPDHAVHLVGFRHTLSSSPQEGPRQRVLEVTNKFGSFRVKPVGPSYFYAPSAVSFVGVPPQLPAPPTVDHFLCYHAHGPNLHRFPISVTVQNEFTSLKTNVKRIKRLCLATSVNDGGFIDPTAALLCYTTSPTHFPVATPVYASNEFDSGYLPLFRAPEVCIVSHVALPTPTTTTEP